MKIEQNVSLLSRNTFGMDVRAAAFAEYSSVDELCRFVAGDAFAPYRQRFLCIGAGSNLLFAGDYEGLVVHSAMRDIAVVHDDGDSVVVRAGSGCVWDDFVRWSVSHGFYGAENLSAIPGEVGASAVQNIGAYGAEVCQLIVAVHIVDDSGCERTLTCDECRYGYRDSIFKHELRGRCFVTAVDYRLSRVPTLNLGYGSLAGIDAATATAATVSDAVRAIRAQKLPDPAVTGNAGSFFKNPVVERWHYEHLKETWREIPCYAVDDTHVKVPAAWLIEQCGWKGRRVGQAAVHDRQALVLVNLGGATGRDIMALAASIADDVHRTFGIDISPEVNYIEGRR